MDPTPVIVIEDLHKQYPDFWGRPGIEAVRGLSLEVAPGEIVGLLGPNGSGKSTTLKLLLGLLRPTRGRLKVFGHEPRQPAARQRLGYLPEETALYDYLTGRETLDFFARLAGRPANLAELLETVGLTAAADRRVGGYSKGMRRRLGLAQALLGEPEVLILDEPTSGLDPVGRRQVKDLLLERADQGVAVLLSSHLLGEVEDVCQRVVILDGGRVIARGQLAELLREPEPRRIVADGLEPAEMAAAMAALDQTLGPGRVRLEADRRSLEALFLETLEGVDDGDG